MGAAIPAKEVFVAARDKRKSEPLLCGAEPGTLKETRLSQRFYTENESGWQGEELEPLCLEESHESNKFRECFPPGVTAQAHIMENSTATYRATS